MAKPRPETETWRAKGSRDKAVPGPCGVIGDGMVRKAACVNQGDLLARSDGVHAANKEPKNRTSRSQSAHSSWEVS